MRVSLKKKDTCINTSYEFPGDKSIAHRSLLIGALGKGSYRITNFPSSLDCLSTVECMRKLGVDIITEKDCFIVNSPGYNNFNRTPRLLNANNSGTTARLLSGLLAGCGIQCTLDGDSSLRKRPMDRIINPLATMGAEIQSENKLLPLAFKDNGVLNGIDYKMQVDSAQVKSCILIAGFMAKDITTIFENKSTRNHTEKMLEYLGACIKVNDNIIKIKNSHIETKDIHVPGDISSAAFLIASALLSENSSIVVKDILLNQRRRVYLDTLITMGANISYEVTCVKNNEEQGNINVSSSKLRGIEIQSDIVPNIIDEIPMLAVIAAFSEGKTVITGVKELKYKESNRLKAIGENLASCGIPISYSEDTIEIEGANGYIDRHITINPSGDHRIALAFAVFALRNLGTTVIENWECTDISFPKSLNYFKDFLDIHTDL
jgi:3-phosphoshikimate 1-carboxyvinyltransferase